jgi:hypothetical protein
MGARSSVVLATNRKIAGSIPDEVIFSIYLILQAALCPRVYSEMSTRNIQIRKFLGSKVWPVYRTDSLTAICEPIV